MVASVFESNRIQFLGLARLGRKGIKDFALLHGNILAGAENFHFELLVRPGIHDLDISSNGGFDFYAGYEAALLIGINKEAAVGAEADECGVLVFGPCRKNADDVLDALEEEFGYHACDEFFILAFVGAENGGRLLCRAETERDEWHIVGGVVLAKVSVFGKIAWPDAVAPVVIDFAFLDKGAVEKRDVLQHGIEHRAQFVIFRSF